MTRQTPGARGWSSPQLSAASAQGLCPQGGLPGSSGPLSQPPPSPPRGWPAHLIIPVAHWGSALPRERWEMEESAETFEQTVRLAS